MVILVVIHLRVFGIILDSVKGSIVGAVRYIVGTRDKLTVVAREPASNTIYNTIPPAALELGDDLNYISFVETETSAIVGLVVVEGADIHGPHWGGTNDAVHEAPGGISPSCRGLLIGSLNGGSSRDAHGSGR